MADHRVEVTITANAQPELVKLRQLVAQLENDRHYPGTSYEGWEQRHAELVARVQAQSVLALAGQLERGLEVLERRIAVLELRMPCDECGGPNGAHFGTCSRSAMRGGGGLIA